MSAATAENDKIKLGPTMASGVVIITNNAAKDTNRKLRADLSNIIANKTKEDIINALTVGTVAPAKIIYENAIIMAHPAAHFFIG